MEKDADFSQPLMQNIVQEILEAQSAEKKIACPWKSGGRGKNTVSPHQATFAPSNLMECLRLKPTCSHRPDPAVLLAPLFFSRHIPSRTLCPIDISLLLGGIPLEPKSSSEPPLGPLHRWRNLCATVGFWLSVK